MKCFRGARTLRMEIFMNQSDRPHDIQPQEASSTTISRPFEQEEMQTKANRRVTSPRKVDANRRNALRSTGPRTPDGKKRIAKNAIKRGFSRNGSLLRPMEKRTSKNMSNSMLLYMNTVSDT